MKTCSKCEAEKLPTEFSVRKDSCDGLNSCCKSCKSAAASSWAQANPEKKKANSAAWVAANPVRSKATNAAYYANNKDKAKSDTSAWRAANPEKVRAYKDAYYKANAEKVKMASVVWGKAHPESHRITEQNRRAKKRAAGGRLSKSLSAQLFKLQRGKCACCGQRLGKDFHLDHSMPLALGGSNTDGNMQLLRSTCNLQKSAKHPVDFMQSRGFLL